MAFNFSPKTVTSGLVLALDAGNVKSYPGTGTAWNDLTGNANNGTLTNGPTFNSANGGSIVFDGVDDYVSISQFISDPIELSVCLFGKVSSSTSQVFFGHRSESTRLIQITAQSNTELRYQLRSSGNSLQQIIKTGLNLNNWTYICITFNKNANNFYLYINGIQEGYLSYNFGSETFTSTGEYIGCSSDGTVPYVPLNGNISEVKKYNRALSAQEVLQNYNALKGRFNLT